MIPSVAVEGLLSLELEDLASSPCAVEVGPRRGAGWWTSMPPTPCASVPT